MPAKEEKKVITNLEPDVVFKGVFKFSDTLLVKGRIEGTVEGKDGKIIIENTGKVEGMTVAQNIDNFGAIKGTVHVLDEYNLFKGALNDAELKVKSIMIEKGATFNGSCKMEN